MKTITKLTSILVLILVSEFFTVSAQSMGNVPLKRKLKAGHLVTSPNIGQRLNRHKPEGNTSYVFLDYPYSDSITAAGYLEPYSANPSIGLYYIQQMNMHYAAVDTGATLANEFLLHSCSVAFDSLLDASSGKGYSASGIVVDSLYIPIGQQNLSGKNDTLIVQINSLGADGIPTTTVLWSKTIIQDTGLSGKGKSWDQYITVLPLAPNLTLSATSKFAVTLLYYDKSKKDTMGFLYGSPTYTCSSPSYAFPDTTFIGAAIPVSTKKMIANSFTTGYSYFTATNHNGSAISLPSTTYGSGLTYTCSSPGVSSTALSWQDIAIYAEVSFANSSLPDVTASASPSAICAGSSSTLTAGGATTYTWSPSTGLSATTGATVTASPGSTTTYTVTGTNTNGSNTATVTVTISVPSISATASPSSIFPGNSSILTAGGGTTYTWSPSTGLNATTGATVTATPASTTTYTVTGTTSCGSNTAMVTVNVSSLAFTQQIISTNGTQAVPTSARICPPTGYATLEAYAGWPFGLSGNLIIGAGQTVYIAAGGIYDYDSINIAPTGSLILDADTAGVWTFIGCRGGFVLNGTIIATNGQDTGGTFTAKAPDDSGHINTTGEVLNAVISFPAGGNGGTGGESGCPGSPPSYPATQSSNTSGGLAYYGNGGGGGGGGGENQSPPGYATTDGYNGGNATFTTSGYGGAGASSTSTNGVSLFGNNGIDGLSGTAIGVTGSSGGSGGTRGSHGQLLYIKAMKSISGTGAINISGMDGGNGGNGGNGNGCSTPCNGSAGGGGGGAGGSGGNLQIRYDGPVPAITVIKNGGTGGSGGTGYYGCFRNGTNGSPGQNGDSGSFDMQYVAGYSYAWRQNANTIAGATSYIYNATAAGTYDCKIVDSSNSNKVYFTSGPLTLKRDTVYTDNQPIAQIVTSSNTVCAGDSVKLAAQFITGQTYEWVYNNNPIVGATNDYYYVSQAGQYFVVVNNSCTVNNPPGAFSAIDTITVKPLPPAPTITITGTNTFCQGDSVILTSSDASNNKWNRGDTTQSITVKTSGNYAVTFTGSNGCSATSSNDSVTEKPASINAGHDTALTCGNSITLNAVCNPPTPTSIVWKPSTYLSSSTIVDPVCTPTATVTYTITANLSDGCTAKDSIKIQNNPVSDLQICMVTVDSLSDYNVIMWDKTGLTHVEKFFIYRDTANNNFALIGQVPFDSLSEFTDTVRTLYAANGNPNVSSWRYAIAAIDSCGNLSPRSPYHQTIFFQNSSGNFSWDQYQIEGQSTPIPELSQYIFQRDNLSNGNYTTIQTLSASSTSYTDPSYASYKNTATWRVLTDWSIVCTPTKSRPQTINNTTTRSNTQHNSLFQSVQQIINTSGNISVFPNPANQTLNIKFSAKTNDARISIEDVTGREVYNSQLTIDNSQLTMDISGLSAGVYFVKVTTNNSSQVVKFVKE
ncbi:MAG: T9SS type A sorting domain-containing protein [Bacteroidia bacterium]